MREPSQIADTSSPSKKRRSWLRFSLKSLMVLLTLACVVLGGKLKYDWYRKKWLVQKWIGPIAVDARQSKDGKGHFSREELVNLPDWPEGMAAEDEVELLKFGILELEKPIERCSALYLLVEMQREESLPALWSLLPQCRHADTQAVLLHLVSLPQNPEDVSRIKPYLQSPAPEVRAAAAEAIGFIHEPSYGFAVDFAGGEYVQLNTVPSISGMSLIRSWHDYDDYEAAERERQAKIPASARDSLERTMLHGATDEERTAAARALVAWPPKDYSLRLSEWGVWIDDQGKLGLAKSVLEENPPFVHRIGNPNGSLLMNRSIGVMAISKPIVHLTADRPLAVDLQVAITKGRPWYAYPRPDDITVHWDPPYDELEKRSTLFWPWGASELSRAELHELDPPPMPTLDSLSEGYSWIHPSYRGRARGDRGDFQREPTTVREWLKSIDDKAKKTGIRPKGTGISAMGLSWQSLIVNPVRESWGALAEVPDSYGYRWWTSLREVPSCWVTSQGESERFLYYDGPTLAKPPVTAKLEAGKLLLNTWAMLPTRFKSTYHEPREKLARNRLKPRGRDCLYVEVSPGQPRAIHFHLLPVAGVDETLNLVEQTWLKGDSAEQALLDILLHRGLTKEEAAGLIASWRERFFQAPGQRLLTFLTPAEYDRMCPLEIRPATTEQVRVGIVLTEF